MPASNTSTRAAVGWPDMLEELVDNSAIVDGHHTLLSVVMWIVRSVQSGLNNVVQGFLTGFEVSQVMFFFLIMQL